MHRFCSVATIAAALAWSFLPRYVRTSIIARRDFPAQCRAPAERRSVPCLERLASRCRRDELECGAQGTGVQRQHFLELADGVFGPIPL